MRPVSADPATQIALEQITPQPGERVLVLHCPDPALALALGKSAADVAVYDNSLTALARVRSQAAARKVETVTAYEDVFPEGEVRYDLAVLTVPKGRGLAQGWVYAARKALKPGGRLYIAGPTEGGAKTLIADAALVFGNGATLAFRKRNRVGVSTNPDTAPEFPPQWGPDPTQVQQHDFGGLPLWTMPGIFSWDHLDDGTAMLLDALEVEGGESVLDVGCGNGVIGLTLKARGAGAVTLTDENLLAVRCSRRNAETLPDVEVLAGDVYGSVAGRTFDLIVSNPPFHQKFDVDTNVAHRIMREALEMLTPGGRLVIVANAFLKYGEVMEEHLARVRELANDGRYVVIEGRKPERGTPKPAGKRGSKRADEQDEAQRFRTQGIIPTVSEEELAEETTDDELDILFAQLADAEAERASGAVDEDFDEDDNSDDEDDEDDFNDEEQ